MEEILWVILAFILVCNLDSVVFPPYNDLYYCQYMVTNVTTNTNINWPIQYHNPTARGSHRFTICQLYLNRVTLLGRLPVFSSRVFLHKSVTLLRYNCSYKSMWVWICFCVCFFVSILYESSVTNAFWPLWVIVVSSNTNTNKKE